MMPDLYTEDMKPLRLSTLIGKGGEGEVYLFEGRDDQVVKFYTVADLRSREAKIKKMIADGLAKTAPLIAFPTSLVRSKSGAFVGFTMAKVSGHQPLHELYAPGVRKASFPTADYRFLVRTAANIARAVGAAHNANCVIGDINHSGILISTRATVTLIDADSFQIFDGGTRHACKVGTPEYTPPELQKQNLDGVLRTQNHDAFGLAVVIFQLLWMGRHPFSGKYSSGEMPMERAISEFRFAYSSRSVGMQPPPATPLLREFPVAIGAAFEQAFGPHGVVERLTAKHWIALLKELEDGLAKCKANTLHHYAPEANECPWCRMERMFGVPLFVPALPDFTHGTAFTPTIGSIDDIWRAIVSVAAPNSTLGSPTLNIPKCRPSVDAESAKSGQVQLKAVGVALLAVAAGIIFFAPGAFLLALIAGGFGLKNLFGKTDPAQDFVRRYRDAETRRLQAEEAWKARSGPHQFEALRSELGKLKAEYDSLGAEGKRRIEEYTANRRSEQMRVFLEGFQIRRTKIAYIGPAKLAMLTSYGIETAADVSSAAVQNVPGFGPTNSKPLLEWRTGLERRFVYNSSPTPADAIATNRIRAEVANRATKIKEELATGPDRLRKLAAAVQQMQSTADPALLHASNQSAQALADLECLGIAPPNVTLPKTWSPNTPSAPKAPVTSPNVQSQTCPRCGSRMITRTARRGSNAGNRFWGCTRFPICKGTRTIP